MHETSETSVLSSHPVRSETASAAAVTGHQSAGLSGAAFASCSPRTRWRLVALSVTRGSGAARRDTRGSATRQGPRLSRSRGHSGLGVSQRGADASPPAGHQTRPAPAAVFSARRVGSSAPSSETFRRGQALCRTAAAGAAPEEPTAEWKLETDHGPTSRGCR